MSQPVCVAPVFARFIKKASDFISPLIFNSILLFYLQLFCFRNISPSSPATKPSNYWQLCRSSHLFLSPVTVACGGLWKHIDFMRFFWCHERKVCLWFKMPGRIHFNATNFYIILMKDVSRSTATARWRWVVTSVCEGFLIVLWLVGLFVFCFVF